jgi:hypothetical protein
MCIPDLRTRIMNLATNRYYNLYSVLINYLKHDYKPEKDHNAVYNAYRDYELLIKHHDGVNQNKVKIPKSVIDRDYESHGDLCQDFDMEDVEVGTDDDKLPSRAISEMVEYLMDKYKDEYLGLNPEEIMESDPLELVIKHCKLNQTKYTPTFK